VKVERFQRNLRVKLTADELAERAQRAAHLLNDRDQKDEESKAAAKHAKAQIAEVEAELRRVSSEIRDGATYKEVACERRHNFRLGKIEEVRMDTHDVIAERAMTDRERQLDLGLDDPKVANGNGKKVGEISESFLDDEDDDNIGVDVAADDDALEDGDAAGEDDDEEPSSDEDYEPRLATQKAAKKKATKSRAKKN
jgi:hypothetical protein